MKKYTYQIHLDPEPEGGFTVIVHALAGCVTWGKDYNHALQMAQQAIEGYLEALVELGKPIPEEPVTTPVDTVVQVRAPVTV